MLNKMFRESIKQNYELDMLLKEANESVSKVESVSGDGDRVWYSYIDSFDLSEKSNKVQYINFNISGDCDFVAKRFYLVAKMNRQGLAAGAANDIPGIFRPFHFAHDGDVGIESQLDCQVALTESYIKEDGSSEVRAYQDQPIPVALTYSHNNSEFGSPSSLHFTIDWEVKRNSVIQCEVSVLTAINNIDSDLNIDEYRIQGVLEGYKKVRAFK